MVLVVVLESFAFGAVAGSGEAGVFCLTFTDISFKKTISFEPLNKTSLLNFLFEAANKFFV